MLAAIAEKLAEKDLSIEDVQTQLRLHNNRREFVVDAYVSSTKQADKENIMELIADISTIKQDLLLDDMNIRVQAPK